MEDNHSPQNIDQQVDTSSIDQITIVPTLKPKSKVKNPKRIAAGKKLAEYNKKAKEQQKLVQEGYEGENHNDGNDRFFPQTSFTSIIALAGLGLTAIDLFLRYKSQRNDSKIVDFENNNSEFADVDREINPNEVDIKNRDEVKNEVSKSFGGME